MAKYLITGALGEVGTGITKKLLEVAPATEVMTTGIEVVEETLLPVYHLDVVNEKAVEEVVKMANPEVIFHCAGVLSSLGEKNPILAHRVNVYGFLNVLEAARKQCEKTGRRIKVIFPSTIAVYGLSQAQRSKPSSEAISLEPITMYGCNKMYAERLGIYYSERFGMLANAKQSGVDFRCVRFPGLMSADTIPTGGTSDYGAEMIHAAAQRKGYECFVSPETILPFMSMPDAVNALIQLSEVQSEALSTRVYNVGSFSISAEGIAQKVKAAFPGTEITYRVNEARQEIVNSWPTVVDDGAAKRDWGWKATLNIDTTFSEYLFPSVMARYEASRA